MLESELPYRKSDLPAGTSGEWILDHFDMPEIPVLDPPVILPAFWAQAPAGRYTQLRRGIEIFMSDLPEEWWTQKEAIDEAWKRGGHMLITGLGMGLILDAILGDPACPVERITVIEKSVDVINLVAAHYLQRYPDRLEIVNADAFTWQPPEGVRYSIVWHDIWPNLCGEINPPEIKLLEERYRPWCDWIGSWSKQLPSESPEAGDARTKVAEAHATNSPGATQSQPCMAGSTNATAESAESPESKMRIVDRIKSFLDEIGLPCRSGEVNEATVLPGILIDHGVLVFDPDKLKYPGDLLHEAGHLAVMLPDRRRRADRGVGKFAAEEMMAIAWSYAAAIHLEIDPSVVFHPDGYRGGSESIIDNFADGRFLGVPTLQWLGMTLEEKTAKERGGRPFPVMLKWLNEGPNGCRSKSSKATGSLNQH